MVRGLSLPICKWGGVWWGWKRVSAPSPCLLAQDQALIGDEVGAFEGGPGMRDVAWGGGIMTLGACTWQRRVVQEGSRGRQNFFMELTAAGKAGAEKMAATRLIDLCFCLFGILSRTLPHVCKVFSNTIFDKCIVFHNTEIS